MPDDTLDPQVSPKKSYKIQRLGKLFYSHFRLPMLRGKRNFLNWVQSMCLTGIRHENESAFPRILRQIIAKNCLGFNTEGVNALQNNKGDR